VVFESVRVRDKVVSYTTAKSENRLMGITNYFCFTKSRRKRCGNARRSYGIINTLERYGSCFFKPNFPRSHERARIFIAAVEYLTK